MLGVVDGCEVIRKEQGCGRLLRVCPSGWNRKQLFFWGYAGKSDGTQNVFVLILLVFVVL